MIFFSLFLWVNAVFPRKTGCMCIVESRICQGIILVSQYPCISIIFQCVAVLIKAVLKSYRTVDF